jgi:hypothetical protein
MSYQNTGGVAQYAQPQPWRGQVPSTQWQNSQANSGLRPDCTCILLMEESALLPALFSGRVFLLSTHLRCLPEVWPKDLANIRACQTDRSRIMATDIALLQFLPNLAYLQPVAWEDSKNI